MAGSQGYTSSSCLQLKFLLLTWEQDLLAEKREEHPMKPRRRFELVLATLLLLVSCLTSSVAQSSDSDVPYPSGPPEQTPSGAPAQTKSDPPGRVARIQYMDGEVSIQPGGVNDWIAAEMNRPLTTTDRIWTDKNSKAELNVGGGYVRLNSESSLTLTNVSDQTVQLELDQGTLELSVNYLAPGQIYEVDSPNMAFTVAKPGVYRFNVYPNEDQTWVTVRKGEGEATGRGSAVKIKSGQQVRFSNGTSLAHTSEPAPTPDGFDDWAHVRDQRLNNSESARYVAPGVIGYQDLDSYGRWQVVAPYGPIWVPYAVPVGWAPYRFGHWVWIAPWGWTWVDNAAWGFAPFHYGRWVSYGGYWGWAPGPYRYWAPCYSPALVAWVGGPGFGIGFGFGGAGWGVGVNFGWFPLGWGEPFYPWYHGWGGRPLSTTYVRNVNVTNTNITNITNVTNNYYNNNITNTHYVNRGVSGAVTAAPASALASGQPINRVGKPVPANGLSNAREVRNISATPTREAVLGGQAPRSNAVPPGSAFSRSVVTRATPPQQSLQARVSAPASPGSAAGSPVRAPQSAAAAAANPSTQTTGQTGHYVPRPPSAGAATGASPQPAQTAHAVPRPPADSQHNTSAVTGAPSGTHTMTPPATTQQPHSAATAPAPHQGAQPEVHQSTPAHGTGATPHSAPQERPKSENPGVTSAVPQPPANYAYHAAPAYSAASSGYAGNSVVGGSNAARSVGRAPQAGGYSAAPGYSAHGSYSAAPPYAGSAPHTGGYSTPNNYAHMSTPAAPHYSAPAASYSAGTAHYSPTSGGGSHSSGGSGGASHATHGSSGSHSK
jgi:hypothetical protein